MKELVYRFRIVERKLIGSRPGSDVLDVGCGIGENMRRIVRYRSRAIGLDPSSSRVKEATKIGPAVAGRAEALPWRDESFDLVYISHVLHHARDLDLALSESFRVLRPGGALFVIETVENSPLMRLARALQPRWEGDEVLQRFRYADLVQAFERHGFQHRRGSIFNWMYFAWELLPLAFRPLEFFTPFFILLESLLSPLLGRFGGHCWLVGEKSGPTRFPYEVWRG